MTAEDVATPVKESTKVRASDRKGAQGGGVEGEKERAVGGMEGEKERAVGGVEGEKERVVGAGASRVLPGGQPGLECNAGQASGWVQTQGVHYPVNGLLLNLPAPYDPRCDGSSIMSNRACVKA